MKLRNCHFLECVFESPLEPQQIIDEISHFNEQFLLRSLEGEKINLRVVLH